MSSSNDFTMMRMTEVAEITGTPYATVSAWTHNLGIPFVMTPGAGARAGLKVKAIPLEIIQHIKNALRDAGDQRLTAEFQARLGLRGLIRKARDFIKQLPQDAPIPAPAPDQDPQPGPAEPKPRTTRPRKIPPQAVESLPEPVHPDPPPAPQAQADPLLRLFDDRDRFAMRFLGLTPEAYILGAIESRTLSVEAEILNGETVGKLAALGKFDQALEILQELKKRHGSPQALESAS